MEDLISIIVPVYNVEKYIEKCVNSIINQTYKNIEIILVDDGSKDSSGKICDKLKSKDNRIKIIHKQNGGVSDARNAGMKIAKGKYISFVDSDDYVSNDYIEYLYKILKKYNTKISTCGHFICFKNKNIPKTANSTMKVDRIKAVENILYDVDIDLCLWGKLFDINLFKNIQFPKGKLFEDTAITYLLFDQCDYIAMGNECKYYYIKYYIKKRDDSITTNKFNLQKMDLIEMTEKMNSFLIGKYPNLKNACNRRLMWAYMSTYTQIIYTNKEDFKEEKKKIKEYIKHNRKSILKDKKISKRDRISLIIFKCGDFVFKISWNIYKCLIN